VVSTRRSCLEYPREADEPQQHGVGNQYTLQDPRRGTRNDIMGAEQIGKEINLSGEHPVEVSEVEHRMHACHGAVASVRES
jgi:hypothetical protein